MKALVQRQTSKTESLCRLEQSALTLFSSRGYDGTSLRDIAVAAGVPLSLIDRHFGHKIQLFQEIQSKIWHSLDKEGAELLTKARSAGKCGLDEIIRSFAKPVVSLAFKSPDGRATIRLIRESRAFMIHRHLPHSSQRNAVRQLWIDEFITARPTLTRSHAVWGYSFIVDTVYSSQLLDDWLNDLMPASPGLSVDEVTDTIVAFCTAGLDALARLGPLGDTKAG
jgi:AcrR family transcriptional regulator